MCLPNIGQRLAFSKVLDIAFMNQVGFADARRGKAELNGNFMALAPASDCTENR